MATIFYRLHPSRTESYWISGIIAEGYSCADRHEGVDAGQTVSHQRDIGRHVQWAVCEVFVAQGNRIMSASFEKVKRATGCSGR